MRVKIDPMTELQELRAEIAWLRNRNLILAQAVAELRAGQPAEPDDITEPNQYEDDPR